MSDPFIRSRLLIGDEAMDYPGKADLEVPLGIKPAQHQRFSGEQSYKADIVVLGHGVV